jgi:hypothetical protein
MGYSQTRIAHLRKLREEQFAATDVLARSLTNAREAALGADAAPPDAAA